VTIEPSARHDPTALPEPTMHEEHTTATRIMGFVVLTAYFVFLAYAALRFLGVSFVRFHG
jgi:hypothetical protein